MKPAFLFDLDMTLLDTSALETSRNRRNWNDVRARLDQVSPFFSRSFFPHEAPAKLQKQGCPVAVVTSSPRWYAEALLQQFKIPYDTLVAYEDTKEHKPDPAPLNLALERLGRPQQAYAVGDTTGDIEASYGAGVTSIGVAWGVSNLDSFRKMAPDILLYDPAPLLEPEKLSRYGYLAEISTRQLSPVLHRGAVIDWDEPGTKYVALGRYFPTQDFRHASAALSKSILSLKDTDAPAEAFAQALGALISTLPLKQVQAIVCVPPKPGQRNRFEAIFERLRSFVPPDIGVLPDGLRRLNGCANYKQLGPNERTAAVQGVFETDQAWSGYVILIDDVLTTGATIRECAAVLEAGGARGVLGIALATDQRAMEQKHCPRCGRLMRIRTNRYTEQKFWGCMGYPDHCKYSEDIKPQRVYTLNLSPILVEVK